MKKPIGELRPSQLLFTFGVGAIVDLPRISALVMGLDEWDARQCPVLVEDRLLVEVRRRLGAQVEALRRPPTQPEDDVVDPSAPPVGVPVVPFPRWLRCPRCDTLATAESGVFQLVEDEFRSDRTRFVHVACARGGRGSVDALNVRFLLACREGHLSDFPWVAYLYRGQAPSGPVSLTLSEQGPSGDAADIWVKDIRPNPPVLRPLAEAFGTEFECPSCYPHLRRRSPPTCASKAKVILLGASNSWFAVTMSALSIPSAVDRLGLAVEQLWNRLADIPSLEVLRYVAAPDRMTALADFPAEQVWDAIEQRRKATPGQLNAPADLRVAEWHALTQPERLPTTGHFKAESVAPPRGFEQFFKKTTLVQRLREVRALVGFSRIESPGDFGDGPGESSVPIAPLSREAATWVPAVEVNGEGIFLQFDEAMVEAWCRRPDVEGLERRFRAAHRQWRHLRNRQPEDAGFPGIRHILVHTFSHALMRQLSLGCGYAAASLRERLYTRDAGQPNGPMAGVLIYTSAGDSEGTLGGLVSLGDPEKLGEHVAKALEAMELCASDPLCAEHPPGKDGLTLHGACCHACLFAPETSCERANRYLDRSVLGETFASANLGFFNASH